jgi:intein/homing endonuclease
MKIQSIIRKTNTVLVNDCYAGDGYVKRNHGSLPDIDSDFNAERRDEVKAYLERRYNKDGLQRVFSAGTFTTEKIKSVIKDVARTYKISQATTNYLTAILDDNMTWTDLMKMASTDKRMKDFIMKYPDVFEEILPIMGQARSAGIHASALIITPEFVKGERVECFDLLPIRKMGDLLVSEISGNDIDAIGILKNDVLGIRELTRLSDTLNLVNDEYGVRYTILEIASKYLNDPKVFKIIREGNTQGVFQMGGEGITKFIKRLAPDNVNDLIASVALFRPGPLDSGAADNYVRAKRGEYEPTYLWGTYEILKDTYAQMVYQEQISRVAQKVGGLSLGDGVNLVKALSKKKLEKVRKFQDKFFSGAKQNGCPKDAADQIWSNVEDAAKYSFNACIGGHEYLWGKHKEKGRGTKINIGDMWRTTHDYKWAKENGRLSLRRKYNKYGYGTCWSLNEEEKLVINRVVDIRYQGIRPVYRITLANGSTIDVTDNHKHPTLNGEKCTDQLVPGMDFMFIRVGWIKEDTSYRFTDRGQQNDPRYHSNDNVEPYTINTKAGQCGFIKRDTNYTKLEYYEKNLKKDYCEICGCKDKRLEVHHINGDHSDVGENYSNVQTICVSCHKKAHYQMGRTKMGRKGLGTAVAQVVSVVYLCDMDVYDVEMADPYHTFLTGKGVVTCNSHATAYGLTAYVGAWLKTYYPTAFYTVVLRDQDEDKMAVLMNEIKAVGGTEIEQPDINISDENFTADFKHNKIYWSLTRIKQLGPKAVKYIVQERKLYGEFYNLDDFIKRIFKSKFKSFNDEGTEETRERCPVTARSVRNLIFSGAFDKCEHVGSVLERYGLLDKAATLLGFKLSEKEIPEDMRDKHYFWSKQQIAISGHGSIDYRRIYDNMEKPKSLQSYKYIDFKDLNNMFYELRKGVICAAICSVSDKSYKDRRTGETKHFGKIELQQNTETNILTIWDDWDILKKEFKNSVGHIIAIVVNVKWSDYDEKNTLQVGKNSFFKLI